MANQVELALFSGGAVTTANPVPVQSGGGAVDGAAASGNPVPIGGIYNSTPPTYDNQDRTQAQYDSRGGQLVVLKGADSGTGTPARNTGADGQGGSASTVSVAAQPFVYNVNTSLWDRVKKPVAVARIVSAAASTNATVAKASAGDVFKIIGYNAAAALRYIKLYNKATAPTVGTDTPVMTLTIPASSAFDIDLYSLYFATGIGFAFTTAGADADTGALTAGDITGFNLVYA